MASRVLGLGLGAMWEQFMKSLWVVAQMGFLAAGRLPHWDSVLSVRMGCGASHGCWVWEPDDPTLFYVPDTFPAPPRTLPPDHATHQLYVNELNAYLLSVLKEPRAFEKKVRKRRAATLRDPSAAVDKQQLGVEADWLSVGL